MTARSKKPSSGRGTRLGFLLTTARFETRRQWYLARLSAMYARQFWNDDDGIILPYVAIILGVVIGLSALALDGSRLMSVQTQLQNDADALALAGAAELDRRPDSIFRARVAIQGLVKNPISGAEIDQIAEVTSIDFLQSLPANDDLPITTANLTNDPTLAAYVQVTLKIANQMIFPLSAGLTSTTVGAQSVAGYDQIVCNAQPLFVCNPFETSGMTYFQATQALIEADHDPAATHRLVRLAGSQFKNGYSAGDTGYLIPATGALPANTCGPDGEYGIPQALASTQLQACFRLSGINVVPVNDQPAVDALNTRFDIYANGFRSCRTYPPDQNVRKGFVTLGNISWCNAIPAPPNWPILDPLAAPLPIDSNMIGADQSFNPAVSLGDGTWNCAAYWSIAHAQGAGKNSPPLGCTTTDTISRYDVYRYELNFLADRSPASEIGGPQCNPPGVANRRVLTLPIVNCGSSPVPVFNNAKRVPVAAFGKFFLTLPADTGTNGNPGRFLVTLPADTGTSGNPYAEFLGLVERTDPPSTDMVQLNR
ncbi:MAG: pilus assembly protein TadG-related protein [Xanthobacteraceae bacterium]